MGGDEGTILKHKVRARENNRLTNKKPTLDIWSQCRIHILRIETKKAKILNIFKIPNFICIKSSKKLGRVTVVYRVIPNHKQSNRKWTNVEVTPILRSVNSNLYTIYLER